MALPEAFGLAQYRHWKVFGTGTFTGLTVPGPVVQRKRAFAFLYQAARVAGIPFGKLCWCIRQERGELSSRMHLHWLIGHRDWQPVLGEMFYLNSLWDKMPKCGFSRNHIFDQSLNGVEYVSKCLSTGATDGSAGGDYYESAKFGHEDSVVTLSNSLVCTVGGKRVSALRYAVDTSAKVARV